MEWSVTVKYAVTINHTYILNQKLVLEVKLHMLFHPSKINSYQEFILYIYVYLHQSVKRKRILHSFI